MKEKKLKKFYTYSDLAVLKKIEILLKNNDIQFMIRSFEDSAYDGLFTLAKGKGEILLFENDYNKAVNILKKEKILC